MDWSDSNATWISSRPTWSGFPALELGREAARAGGTTGAVLNAANEAAVAGFLRGELHFTEIVPACRGVLEHHDFDPSPTLDELIRARRLGSPGGGTLGMHLIDDNAALGLANWITDWHNWGLIAQVAVGLGMVIFVHELGHFLVAKACGVKCEKFYLGFDIFGLKLAQLPLGRNRIRHRHSAAGRLREDARPGGQSDQGRRGIRARKLAREAAGGDALPEGEAAPRRASSIRAATWPRACRSGWRSSRPA